MKQPKCQIFEIGDNSNNHENDDVNVPLKLEGKQNVCVVQWVKNQLKLVCKIDGTFPIFAERN
jgi:hypothetical protein